MAVGRIGVARYVLYCRIGPVASVRTIPGAQARSSVLGVAVQSKTGGMPWCGSRRAAQAIGKGKSGYPGTGGIKEREITNHKMGVYFFGYYKAFGHKTLGCCGVRFFVVPLIFGETKGGQNGYNICWTVVH